MEGCKTHIAMFTVHRNILDHGMTWNADCVEVVTEFLVLRAASVLSIPD